MMQFPTIKTEEEVAALGYDEQLTYAQGLGAKACELLELARDSFGVPPGSAGAAARDWYAKISQALQVAKHNVGGSNSPSPYSQT